MMMRQFYYYYYMIAYLFWDSLRVEMLIRVARTYAFDVMFFFLRVIYFIELDVIGTQKLLVHT